ncbi:DNA-binding transcriptional regulator, MarR family [Marinospirillum celere]|uniref:DNA-binding transcriptional regulator, MarR family n=1 Tax=Marinospirillum celere TaxID=1122252 RepID=A0A1I1FVS9_9GAMM|nr:MarR family transcriptional regulator [Marinospirillum celere]SFC01153.1 DNA-binding transcriptional regulator, MarR family [Marinospirillum celere]
MNKPVKANPLSKTRALLSLEQFLPFRINHLGGRISCSLSHIYSQEFGISIPEWRILIWLNARETLTAKEICKLSNMDKAKVSRAVHRLADQDYLLRIRDEEDQRTVFLSLSEQGHQLLDKLIPRALNWESELVAGLSAQEYRDLFNIMLKLEQQLDRINACEEQPPAKS